MDRPIKSRHGLTRCRTCRAHIQAAERPSLTDCPFCGANLARGGPRITTPSGRGGVLAASLLAFGLTGCGGSEATSQSGDPASQQQPADPDQPVASDDPSSDPAPGDDYADDPADDNAAVAEYGIALDEYDEAESDTPVAAPRYGLPPSRR